MTWEALLRFVSGPGVAVAVGVTLSFALEHIARFASWYAPLSPKNKRTVYVGLCFMLPVAGALLLAIGAYEPWSWDPLFWRAILGGASAAGIGTMAATRLLGTAEDGQLYAQWLANRRRG